MASPGLRVGWRVEGWRCGGAGGGDLINMAEGERTKKKAQQINMRGQVVQPWYKGGGFKGSQINNKEEFLFFTSWKITSGESGIMQNSARYGQECVDSFGERLVFMVWAQPHRSN